MHLRESVAVSPEELAEFSALPPLRVLALDAPPMARREADGRTYTGIGIDVWCFVALRLGLRYVIEPEPDLTVAEKIGRIQEGGADVLVPLSLQPERARRGLFTRPYYESRYAIIARKGRELAIHQMADLARYRVGVVHGVAFEPILRGLVPAERLVAYDQASSDGMFEALREGAIDVAVYNRGIFAEKRYSHEYFDLEVVLILREYPRAYRFYFSDTPEHRRLVRAFDRYLAAMDVSDSVAQHEEGESQLIERYVAQRSQRVLLQVASGVAVLLALASFLALRRYRRLSRLLAERNQYILRQQEALRAANRELERQSQTDGLTRLANRRHFDQALAREHARWRRTGAPLSLMLLDVDHFKRVNDHYGHQVGDDYLRAIAQALRSSVVRPADLTARYGGEEFACLMPDTGSEAARAVAERIREEVARLDLPGVPEADHAPVRLSIGIATLAGGHAGAQDLLAAADAQLYAAKRAGRDRVHTVVLD
ncbi:GGDEF domain-containing protein [Castellaniella defragrans]|uniref:GGDEF domain-containing protein n=1 Tax=Castellaniella defragrans TaxID=75697 RepID=UPI0023F51E9B|nr:GGDEF domain-containing protein [Castellaniella defragrans]